MAVVVDNLIELKSTVMEENVLQLTNEILKQGLTNYKNEKQLASYIKHDLEKNSGTFGWNVVIGKYFGSSIFHKSKCFSLYIVRDLQILIWKT